MTTKAIERTNFNLIPNFSHKEESCDEHGVFSSTKYPSGWSRCPECMKNEETARIKAEHQQRILDYERKQKENEIAERIEHIVRCGIPERFIDKRISTFTAKTDGQKEALDFSIEYAASFSGKKGRCAIFIGKPGTGKTHLAVGIGMALIGERKSVRFCTVIRAIRRVKESWSKNSEETESQAIEFFVRPDLLILDEVGVQFGSEAEKLILFDIMNERYEKMKSTILVSNLTVPEVKEYLGERIFDRMREDGGRFVSFDWESYRGKSL